MKKILLFLILGVSSSVFSQKKKEEQEVNIIKHTVALGETVKMISKKYRVVPLEIYKLNEAAINGVTGGMVLNIPVPVKVVPTPTIKNDLEVTTKESDNTAVAEKKEVKYISNSKKETATADQVTPDQDIVYDYFITHTIRPKETLYSLSRDYNVPIAIIKENNLQDLKNGLQIGQSIRIPTNERSNLKSENNEEELILENSDANDADNVSDTENKIELLYHIVLSGETLFSLAKKYSTSVEEINTLNEDLSGKGLHVGQTLKIKKH
jgi:LysM repeat protein